MHIINTHYIKLCVWYILQKADELFSAAETGNAAETEKLVQSGVYVDPTDIIVSYV